MTGKEFATWAMALKTYFPRENLLPNEAAMELWFQELQDLPYKVAETALRTWVQTNKWSPSISEIRELAASCVRPELPDWGEAWEQTLKAIRKFGSYRQKEALDSLDPLARKTVERLGFRDLCMSTNTMQDRANFRMIYENLSQREQTKQQIALPLQEAIGRLQLEQKNGMLMIGGIAND